LALLLAIVIVPLRVPWVLGSHCTIHDRVMPAPTVLTPVGPVRMKSAALELVTELMVRSIEPVLVIVIVWAADAVLTRVSAKLSEPPAGVVSEIVGSTPVPDTGTSVVPSTRSLVRTAMVPVRDPVAVGWKTTLTVTSAPAGTVRAHGAGVQVTRKSAELLVIELITRGAVVAPALLRMRKVWAALGVPTRVLGNAATGRSRFSWSGVVPLQVSVTVLGVSGSSLGIVSVAVLLPIDDGSQRSVRSVKPPDAIAGTPAHVVVPAHPVWLKLKVNGSPVIARVPRLSDTVPELVRR
jgi:hypothetical protein